MNSIQTLLTDHLDIWTDADTEKKSGRGRSSGNADRVYGIKKLRELILELAVRGKLVPQDANDEPASELLKRIQAEEAKLIAEGKIKSKSPSLPLLQRGKTTSIASVPPFAKGGLGGISVDEMPFELPQGWEWTTLASVSKINPRNDATDNSPSSFVPMTMIGTSFNSLHDQEPRLWGEIKQGFTHFAEGDIGVAKITPCFENSKACVFSGLLTGIGAGTTELHIVRPFNATLAPRYVLAYLKSPQFLLVGETRMTGTAGQKRLPKEFVESNPFPLPPLAEQHRIVAKVDELMALCDQLEQQQTHSIEAHQTLVETLLGTLTRVESQQEFSAAWARIASHFDTLFTTEASIDQLKQAILQLAVMGKLVPQTPNDGLASTLLKRIQAEKAKLIAEGKIKKDKPLAAITDEEKPFALPKNWEWVKLGDISSTVQYGYTDSANHGSKEVLFLRITDIQDGAVDWHTVPGCGISPSDFDSYALENSDIVIARTGGTIGKSYLVAGLSQKAVFASYLIRIGNLSATSEQYKKVFLGSKLYWAQLIASSMGTGQPNVNGTALKHFIFSLPPLAEQHRIVAKVDELMALCDVLKARLADAKAIQLHLADAIVEQAVC